MCTRIVDHIRIIVVYLYLYPYSIKFVFVQYCIHTCTCNVYYIYNYHIYNIYIYVIFVYKFLNIHTQVQPLHSKFSAAKLLCRCGRFAAVSRRMKRKDVGMPTTSPELVVQGPGTLEYWYIYIYINWSWRCPSRLRLDQLNLWIALTCFIIFPSLKSQTQSSFCWNAS